MFLCPKHPFPDPERPIVITLFVQRLSNLAALILPRNNCYMAEQMEGGVADFPGTPRRARESRLHPRFWPILRAIRPYDRPRTSYGNLCNGCFAFASMQIWDEWPYGQSVTKVQTSVTFLLCNGGPTKNRSARVTARYFARAPRCTRAARGCCPSSRTPRRLPRRGSLGRGERGPEGFGFRRTDVEAENFAPAIAVDADRDDHGDGDDAAFWRTFT
jgi:hypothetical protein